MYGKPQLAAQHAVHFNVAHSHGLWMAAISRRTPIGIDVEQIRDDIPFDALARRFFQPDKEWAAAPNLGAVSFFRFWTRREALLKAHGLTVFSSQDELLRQKKWSITSFAPYPGFQAALALRVASALQEDTGTRTLQTC